VRLVIAESTAHSVAIRITTPELFVDFNGGAYGLVVAERTLSEVIKPGETDFFLLLEAFEGLKSLLVQTLRKSRYSEHTTADRAIHTFELVSHFSDLVGRMVSRTVPTEEVKLLSITAYRSVERHL